jgi:hypothetical protein
MLSNPMDRAMIVNAAFVFSGLAAMLAISTYWKTIANAFQSRDATR